MQCPVRIIFLGIGTIQLSKNFKTIPQLLMSEFQVHDRRNKLLMLITFVCVYIFPVLISFKRYKVCKLFISIYKLKTQLTLIQNLKKDKNYSSL